MSRKWDDRLPFLGVHTLFSEIGKRRHTCLLAESRNRRGSMMFSIQELLEAFIGPLQDANH